MLVWVFKPSQSFDHIRVFKFRPGINFIIYYIFKLAHPTHLRLLSFTHKYDRANILLFYGISIIHFHSVWDDFFIRILRRLCRENSYCFLNFAICTLSDMLFYYHKVIDYFLALLILLHLKSLTLHFVLFFLWLLYFFFWLIFFYLWLVVR